jgi:hypothetical protein
MRHEATGQPYRISRQHDVAWKQTGAWGFPKQYLLAPAHAKPERLREKQFTPMWKETPQFAPCSVYGQGMPQFAATVKGLQRNDPEQVYADPNNPLLKQLLAERAARWDKAEAETTPREASLRPFSSSMAVSTRSAVPSSARASGRRLTPRSSETVATPGLRAAPALRAKQTHLTGPAVVPGVDYRPPVWEAAAAKVRTALGPSSLVRASHEATATGHPAVRYKLVQSLASQPDHAENGTGWQTTALAALQREERALQAKVDQQLGGSGHKADVPLQGALVPRGAAAAIQQARRRRHVRDVGLVRDLVW